MSVFTLFLCGPAVGELAAAAPALLEELAARGVAARVLSDGAAAEGVVSGRGAALAEAITAAHGAGASAVVLVSEPRRETREALAAAVPEAVVIDWPGPGDFEPTLSPHASVTEGATVLAGLTEVFAVLEGLGYLAYGAGEALTDAQDAELVERLKDLGYV